MFWLYYCLFTYWCRLYHFVLLPIDVYKQEFIPSYPVRIVVHGHALIILKSEFFLMFIRKRKDSLANHGKLWKKE